MNSCGDCRFWSDLWTEKNETLRAMCLNEKSECYYQMVWKACRNKEHGRPIDAMAAKSEIDYVNSIKDGRW